MLGGANSLTQWYCPPELGALDKIEVSDGIESGLDLYLHGCHLGQRCGHKEREDPGDNIKPNGSLADAY